jgi:LacI family transcriptional regulator
VSVGTVSKALNGTGQLRAETRARVQASAAALGFTLPSRLTSDPHERYYTVGLITTDSFSRFASPVMLGVEDTLGAGRISVLLADGRGDAIREEHYLRTFLARRVDGIIVTGRRAEARQPIGRQLPVPSVYVLTQSSDPDDLSVVFDDEQGARLAIEHLLSLGHRRIAYVAGPQRHLAARLREAGARAALEAAGLELPPNLVLWGEWSEAWGRNAAEVLAHGSAPVDAVFCGSDQIARGVLEGMQALGRRVPEDVSIIGFDNWDVIVEATRPHLSTIDPDLMDLGRVAARHLLEAIETGERSSGIVRHPCQLVIRDSTGPRRP